MSAHWSRVREIYFAAQDLVPDQRAPFVYAACAGDEELEREVLRLLDLDEDAGEFLERPAVVELAPLIASRTPLLLPGIRLADRYRITSLLGAGGQGEVYEAHDEVIDDVVAVKVARQGFESVETQASRWRREVLAARKVSHSGVCRVHDVGVHRDGDREVLFLTMERLRGPSLHARLNAGPLPLGEGLAILRQVAAALDAAHGQGVLHRDIKPDNIMIEARSGGLRAVLTDFGLARQAEAADQTLTETGYVLGTPGYLAPEIQRGEPASMASDLYAFGVVARSVVAGAMPALSDSLGAVFSRAVHAEPAARFASATELVDAVAATTSPVPARSTIRRTRIALTAASIVAVALILVGLRLYIWKTPTITPASQVLITEMTNATGQSEFDGAGEVLRSQLSQSTRFELIEPERVRAALSLMGKRDADPHAPEIAREVALREGAPLIVYSALTRLGTDYSIGIRLERVGARPSFAQQSWTKTFIAPAKASIFDAMRQAAVWVRQMAGESAPSLEAQDHAPSETTTSSWDALRLFNQANALSAAGKLNEATLILEEALRIDPAFPLAQMRLGDDLISLRRDREGYAAWKRAFDLTERHALTDRETLRIRSQYYDDTGDLAAAEKAHRQFVIHYPDDYYANFLLGGLLEQLSRSAEAVPWLEKAMAVRPTASAPPMHLALVYLDLKRQDDFALVVQHLESIGAKDWATCLRALSTFVAGDIGQALNGLEPLRASTSARWQSRAFTLRASWLSDAGRDAEAIDEIRRGIAYDVTQGFRDWEADKWLHLAELELRLKSGKAAESALRALTLAENARRVADTVRVLASTGAVARAQSVFKRFDALPDVPDTRMQRGWASGEIALGQGDAKSAVRAFENAYANSRHWIDAMPLVLALQRAGEMTRATEIATGIVEHPVFIYSDPEPHRVGAWRSAIYWLREHGSGQHRDGSSR